MTHEGARSRRRWRIALVAAGIATGLLAATVLLLHAPPVRTYALGYGIRALEKLGIRLEAERLDYNLFTLRARLRGVKVSAVGDTQPFFIADDVRVLVSAGAFSGGVPIDEVLVGGGAVHIVRRADGTTNLPRSTGGGQTDPPALPIARFVAERLAVDYGDAAADVAVHVPALTVDLSPRGRLTFEEPADLRIGSTSTRIEALDGGASFDRRDLQLTDLVFATTEVRGRLSGTLAIVRLQPSLDVRVNAEGDLQRAAKWWGGAGDVPGGTVHFEGPVRGPFSELEATLEIDSERIAVDALEVSAVTASVRLNGTGVAVGASRMNVAGGQVAATGSASWMSGLAEVKASWRDVDMARLVTALSDASVVPSGRATGEMDATGSMGDIDTWQGRARTVLGPGSAGRGRLPVPGEARLTLANGSWRLEARHVVGAATPVDASLNGRLRAGRIADSTVNGTIRAPQTDVQAVLRTLSDAGIVPAQEQPFSGTVRAELGVEGTIGRPRARILVDGDRAVVAGQEIVNLHASGELAGSLLTVDELTVEQPAAGDEESTRGRILASGTYNLAAQEYAARVSGQSWRLAPTPDVPLSALVGLEFSGNGRGRLVDGKGRVSAQETRWKDVALGDLTADVDLAGEDAHVVARAPTFDTVADVNVQLRAPYAATVRAMAPALDLARVASGAGLPVDVGGTVDVRIEAEGPLERWRDGRASVEVSALDARIQDLPVVLREPARVRYEAGRAAVERLEAMVGKTPLSVSGALPVWNESPASVPASGDAIVALLTGDVYDVAVAASLVSAGRKSADPIITGGNGPLALLGRVTGTLTSPVIAADLEAGPATVLLREGIPPIEQLQVRAHLADGLLELREFSGTYQGGMVTAQGQAPLALLTGGDPGAGAGDAVVRATAVGVTAAMLAPFVEQSTLDQIGGSLDATIDLSAPALNLDAVRGEVVLNRLELSVADLPITQRTPTRVVARDGLARIDSWEWEGEGRSLKVTGQVRLGDRQAAIFADGTLDGRLLTPFLRAAGMTTAGQIQTRLSVTGEIVNPTINGDLRLTDGEVRIREPRIVASDLNAQAVLARDFAYITSLTGTVNGGTLTGTGRVQYSPTIETRFSTTVTGMAMEFPQGLRTEIDSSLELTMVSGSNSDGGRLSGLVTVKRGAYREPLALVTGLLTNLRRSSATTGSNRSPVLERLTLDVGVVTDEDLVIQNNVARAQLGADLRVINTAAAPALSGRAELREGGQLFLGSNTYTVQSGTIDFANPTTIEPILGIEATTRVSGVEIEVHLTGPPETLMTELSSPSDPDLGQADLTSLLLTGRRLEELGTQQAAIVGAQVLGNDVLGFAGRAVGLDTLRVGGVNTTTLRDPAEVASEADPTSRVTFGKSLGSKLDVTFSQSLREGDAQTWIIDYLPVRRVNLRLVSNDDDLRSYEFRHDVIFGAAPQRIRSGDASARSEPPRVSAVRFTGDPGFPEAQLRRELRLTERDRFDFIDWQEDRDRLERFYRRQRRFGSRVQARREESAEGVVLTYELTAGPQSVIRIDGARLPARVIEEIETAWAQSVFDGFLTEEAEQIVRRELAAQSSYQAVVKAAVEQDGATRTLVIDVTPGPRVDRIEVRFDGPVDPLLSELNAAVGDRADAQRALTNPAEYERTVVAALQSRGYQQASVAAGRPVFDGALAIVPVTVKAGPQFRIGRVTVEGAAGLPVEELHKEAAAEEGGVYRADDVEEARRRLLARYRRDGYLAASLEVRQNIRDADGMVDLTFVVNEGARQVIGEVNITGNQSVNERVITRALRLTVGDSLRTADWLEARRRLFETGLFRRVDILIEPIGEPGPTVPVRLRVVLEEWPALRLRYGLQVAEERPEEEVNNRDLVPGISADVTRRTLFGRAITVGAAGQYQRRERVGRVFTSTPTFFGRQLQSSLVLERSREEQRDLTLVTDRTAASWEQRTRRGSFSVSYGLRFERNRTYDTAPVDPDFAFDLTAHIGRLTSSVTWDTRDDAGDATRGTFASATIEHASSAFGSDLLFNRSLSQAYHFRTWKRVVLASAARYGIVVPLGGQVIGPQQRFYSGGARSVRGVPEDGLGGRDFLGLLIGGESLLIFNQEARFPVYKWLRGVAFVDAGNVFPKPADLSLTDLVGSAGVGLRFVTPFALFRLDYGKTIWNRPVQDSGRLVFGIGQSF